MLFLLIVLPFCPLINAFVTHSHRGGRLPTVAVAGLQDRRMNNPSRRRLQFQTWKFCDCWNRVYYIHEPQRFWNGRNPIESKRFKMGECAIIRRSWCTVNRNWFRIRDSLVSRRIFFYIFFLFAYLLIYRRDVFPKGSSENVYRMNKTIVKLYTVRINV